QRRSDLDPIPRDLKLAQRLVEASRALLEHPDRPPDLALQLQIPQEDHRVSQMADVLLSHLKIAGNGLHLVDQDGRDPHVAQVATKGVDVTVELWMPECELVSQDAVQHHD